MISAHEIDQETPARLSNWQSAWQTSVPTIQASHRGAIAKSLLRTKFAGQQRLFVAHDDQHPVAHVVARLSPTLRDQAGNPLGILGFFESLDDRHLCGEMLAASVVWLRKRGATSIVGPMDGDTWHKYRINIGPFTDPPFLMEPQNPHYYSGLWKQAGFETLDSFHSKVVENIAGILPAVEPAIDRARAAGYRFRQIVLSAFTHELKIVYRLSTEAFSGNFLYDEITFDEFKSLYDGAATLLDPSLVWFALDSNGQEIGFLFCVVDYVKAVAAMQGKRTAWAKLKFLVNRSRAAAVNFKSLGVLPTHRRSSVAAALMAHGYCSALGLGYRRANLCLIRDGNPSSKLDGAGSKILRRYELYQFPGSQLENQY